MVRHTWILGLVLLASLPSGADPRPTSAPAAAAPAAPSPILPMDGHARSSVAGAADDANEPEELRALREWELATFPIGVTPPPAPPRPADLSSLLRPDGAARTAGLPDALTSRAPSAPRRAAEGDADTTWLQGLTMPDLPFRWDDNVLYYLKFWKNDPRGRAIMTAWLRRLGRYAPMIRRVLRAEGLPEDLVYVAMIESSYDPTARSSVGATGLWQLMPRAGEIYGLEQNHWVDERRHPERSTRAAAAFFRDLNRRFGDWDLVLAAYHMGYGALLQSIRKYNCNDYWQLARIEAGLPYETTYYVPKILAAALVGRNPERFGFGAVAPEAERAAEVVEVPSSLDLATLARAAGTTRDEIATFNPHLLRGRTPPVTGPYRVLGPAGKAQALLAALPRLRPELRRWARYTPRFGETLAMVAHRFRTTVRAIAELNGMDDDDVLRPATVLVVPAVDTPRADARPGETPVVSVPPRRFTYTGRRRVFYSVLRGDTTRQIASFFGVTTDDLRQWNAIEPDARLQEGMVLQVFVPGRVDLSRAVVMTDRQVRILVQGTDEFFDYQESQRGRRRIRYSVQQGDTLQSIGRRFGLSLGSMARINRVERDVVLEPGRTLIVYAPATRSTAGAAAANAAASTEAQPAPAAPPPAAPQTGQTAETPQAAAAEPASAAPASSANDVQDGDAAGPTTQPAADEAIAAPPEETSDDAVRRGSTSQSPGADSPPSS